MKLLFALVTGPLAVFVRLANANFDIYAVGSSHFGTIYEEWQIFDDDPSCEDVMYNYRFYATYGDVSSTPGFRCEGDCHREGRADGIEVLEMHLNSDPLYHFTIYRDSDYILWGTDNVSYGECFPYPDNSFNCPAPLGPAVGHRKFRCLSEFTATQMAGI